MTGPSKFLQGWLDYCCPESRPDLKGDLLELYDQRCRNKGKTFANRKLLLDALSIVPLNFIMEEKKLKPVPMLSTYLKIARRNLIKNKFYTAINILGLSVSITTCIIIALFIRDELSFDKHFDGADRIYRVAGSYSQGGEDRIRSAQTSYLVKPMIEHDIEGIETITRVDVFTRDMVTVGETHYQENTMVFADSTFFDVFPIPFIKGERATALHGSGSVVIDRPTAVKYFGTDDALGKLIELRGKQFMITGVFEPLPANTHFSCSMVFPISGVKQWYPDWVLTNASGTSLLTYVRLRNPESAARFEKIATQLVKDRWGWANESAPHYFLQPLTSIHLESNLQGEIGVNGSMTNIFIFATTALVILILASINYVNLTTAASFQRSKEVGMKKVFGSTTRMLMSQFQTESFIVALISMVLAMVFARLAMPFFNQLSGKTLDFSPFTDALIGPGLVMLLMLIAGVAGAAPAFVLLRSSTIGMLTDKLSWRTGKSYLRSGLIVFQFSISIALITCTLIVVQQIDFIRKSDLGIDPEAVVLIPVGNGTLADKYDLFKTEMMQDPAVISVGASSNKVTERIGGWRGYKPDPALTDPINCSSVAVSADFFETMRAHIVEGRTFSKDRSTDVTNGYILNESAVKLLNIDQPVGKELFGATFTGSKWHQRNGVILGVVKDFHYASLHEKVQPVVFYMASELTEALGWMEVRIASNNMPATIASLKKSWASVAGEQPFEFEFMDEAIDLHYRAEDRFLKIFTAFSVLSIMLGGLGLFGLTAFMAKRRTREIGIRRVLGATTALLIKTLSADFLKLVLIANLIGWPLAWYFMRGWLDNFAYHAALSPWLFGCTGIGVFVIAFLCILYHSLKATRVSPVTSLRTE